MKNGLNCLFFIFYIYIYIYIYIKVFTELYFKNEYDVPDNL